MFEFLKNKLKQVVSSFSKKIETEAKPVEEISPKIEEHETKQPDKLPLEHKVEKPKIEPQAEQQHKPILEPKPILEHKPEPKMLEPREQPIQKHAEKKEVPSQEKIIQIPIQPSVSPPEKKEQHKAQDQNAQITKPIPEPAQEITTQPKEEKRTFFGLFKKREKEEPVLKTEVKKPEISEPSLSKPSEKKEPEPSLKEEKRNIFDMVKEKIAKQTINDKQFEDMFSDLEMALLENNVALEVIDKIKHDLKTELVNKPLERGKIEQIIERSLRDTIEELFDIKGINLIERVKEKKPYIICFVGINGSGKTTTIAKLAHLLKKHHLSSVMAASDTFRAAAIQQLEVHADRLGVKLIKHDYGSDSAAVAFDAISYAKAHSIDVVMIDTAGRLHSNTNLMDEIKKVKRVTNPDLVIFVGESITGNDCVEQAKAFNEQLGIDAIILAKSDVDEKGGAAISISYITKKPIMYLGTGQNYDDLIEFDPKLIVKSLGLES